MKNYRVNYALKGYRSKITLQMVRILILAWNWNRQLLRVILKILRVI